MNTEADMENWVLFQSRYDYIAVPAGMAVELLKTMKVVDSGGNLAVNPDINMKVMNGEQMTVAIAKSKMLPHPE